MDSLTKKKIAKMVTLLNMKVEVKMMRLKWSPEMYRITKTISYQNKKSRILMLKHNLKTYKSLKKKQKNKMNQLISTWKHLMHLTHQQLLLLQLLKLITICQSKINKLLKYKSILNKSNKSLLLKVKKLKSFMRRILKKFLILCKTWKIKKLLKSNNRKNCWNRAL